MRQVRITDPLAAQAVAAVSDETVSAAHEEELMAAEVAEIDRLIDEVDRDLAAQERTESVRITREVTDQVRARRARRRANRELLRALTSRGAADLGEVA